MEQIEYKPLQRTRPIVEYLMGVRDNTSTVKDMVEFFDMPVYAIRAVLKRLQRVGRVACIHEAAEMWHLE